MRHRFHSLYPYFAMFPESFVQRWVERLSKPGEVVFDPFCGRGTTPFQALLMGRDALACDINPVAYCVTRAKICAPGKPAIRRRITELENGCDPRAWHRHGSQLPEFFHHAYHPKTLLQLLYIRSALKWEQSDVDCMIAALILGALHGESQKSGSYLSNQMPRTISTKPAYSVQYWHNHHFAAPERNVFELLRDRLTFRYESGRLPCRGTILKTDMRELPRLTKTYGRPIACAITSPPYLDVTNFEEDQWLRLWFLGGAPRPTYGVVSKDDRHERADRYWDLISDLWRVLGQMLCRKAHVVIRMGGKNLDPERMQKGLLATSLFSQRKVSLQSAEVSEIKGRQTNSFRPGTTGCVREVDFHFALI